MATLGEFAETIRKHEEERHTKAKCRLEKYLVDNLPDYKSSTKRELSPEEKALFSSRISVTNDSDSFTTRIPVIFEDDLSTKVGVYLDVSGQGLIDCTIRNRGRRDLKELIGYVLQRERQHYVKIKVGDEATAKQIEDSLQGRAGILEMEVYKASEDDKEEDFNDFLRGE